MIVAPSGLRDAARLGKLVPFVGAGASRIAGCPGWSEFADAVLEDLVTKGAFDHAQLDQIRSLDPKVKLSIARSLEEEGQIDVDFQRILKPRDKDVDKGKKLYTGLSKLGRTFVTTNYDTWLDEVVGPDDSPRADAVASAQSPKPRSRRILHKKADLLLENLQPDTVVHLHGWVKAPEEMILTTQDYVGHYANDHRDADRQNRVLAFLEDLFKYRVILFVGYGLEELEILQYVFQKSSMTTGPSAVRHYLLQGFFSHQSHLHERLRRYYLQWGIEMIPYSRDVRDWDALIDVVDDLASQIEVSTPLVVQELREMEDMIDDFGEPLDG